MTTQNISQLEQKHNLENQIKDIDIMTREKKHIEDRLKQEGHRILIVDTSGTDDFILTRKFYEKLNYHKEAVIRDFWDEGDDKVIYWKKLN